MSSFSAVSLLLIFFSVLPSDVNGFACTESEFSCHTNYLYCTLTTSNETRANYLLTQCSLDNANSYNTFTVNGLDNATLTLNIPFHNGYYLTINGANTLIISNEEILARQFTLSSNGLLTIPHVFPPLPNAHQLILQRLEFEAFPTIKSPNMQILTINYLTLPNTTVILPSMLVIPSLRYITLTQSLDAPWFLLNPDTFDNMLSHNAGATYINLYGVLNLNSYQFANVVNLRELNLNYMPSNVTYEKNAFAGLPVSVTFFYIENSEFNVMNLIRDETLPSVVHFRFRHNLITSLPQEFFERQKAVVQLEVDNNPLNCTCEMSWVSYAYYTLGWTITGTCTNGNNIFDNSNYVNCPIQSYHCFNDTLVCPTDSSRCVNTQDSAYCECSQGYASNSSTCVDIDECSLGTDNCSQNCANTEGGYNCTCLLGYLIGPDLASCVDIDECSLGTDNCSQNCTNTEGLYECFCEEGYDLQSDSFSCNKSGSSRLSTDLTYALLLFVLLLSNLLA